MENKPQASRTNLTLWIIWGGLLSSVVLYYAGVQTVLKPSAITRSADDILVKILGGISLAVIAAAFFVRQKITHVQIKTSSPANFQKVLAGCIISWALAESVAIYGLILAVLGTPISICGMFFLASFAALVFLSPKFPS